MDNIFNATWLPAQSYIVAALLVLLPLLLFLNHHSNQPNLSVANPGKLFGLSVASARKDFVHNARGIIDNFLQNSRNGKSRNFQVNSEFGRLTVLMPKFIPEIRNDPRLSFARFMAEHTMSRYPGFEVFSEGAQDSDILKEVIRLHLNKDLAKVTEPLSEETAFALEQTFTDRKDWHLVPLKAMVLEIVARISSRVFTGPELCRDPSWLKISTEYTVHAMRAVHEMRAWSPAARPIVHWFLPSCRKLRSTVKEARAIVNAVLEKRRADHQAAQHNDALKWFEDQAKGRPYDPAIAQMVLVFVSAHTTTDLLTQVLFELAQHPELIDPLRREVISEIGEKGWKGFSSQQSLKLLDSVIKETQRLKPIGINGTRLPKGTSIMVLADRHWDSSVYANPEQYDGYRFLRMRSDPTKETAASLVGTSPDHLGFGYGLHACPGRFFAAHELKIALSHILLKYDWRIPQGQRPQVRRMGVFLDADPVMKVEIRRRREEVVL
ncbi:hypothetical protein VTN96DRAFT_7741 [Rasamsonia emersonii]